MATVSLISRDSLRALRTHKGVVRAVKVYRQALELIRDGRRVDPDLLSKARDEVSRYAYAAILETGAPEQQAAQESCDYCDGLFGPAE